MALDLPCPRWRCHSSTAPEGVDHEPGRGARGRNLGAYRRRLPQEGVGEDIRYDFLINATGPKLNFGATPGLGPGAHSLSVCTETHADETARALGMAVERMRRGERQRFLVGTGHGACTCEGAAFEYIVNLEFELRARGVRDRADIQWISNEYELGDFGMGGMHLKRGGYVTPSKTFVGSLFAERGIQWITRAHVRQVGAGVAHYETIEGPEREIAFDFAMLLPPFAGVGLTAVDPAAPRVPVQGPAQARLEPDSGVTMNAVPTAPVPTRWTVFLRTFVPWQMVRFVVINLKMLRLSRRSH